MTDAIRTAMEAATTYLGEHPDEARYTDSLAAARVNWERAIALRCDCGSSILEPDERVEPHLDGNRVWRCPSI